MKVLAKGVQWRVGDGRSIDMWMEAWVPRITDFYLRAERGGRPRWVSQLIRDGEWVREEVEGNVRGDYVSRILAMPISRRGLPDKLVWTHTRCGNYLTCSDYKCAQSMKRNGELRGKGYGTCRRRCYELMKGLGNLSRNGWQKETKAGTVGIVARGDQGEFRGVFFKQLKAVPNAFVVEVVAIREGLQFAWMHNILVVEVETDCKQIVSVINGEIQTPMEVEVVVEDILYLTRYLEVKVHYVKRAINNTAHCMAHWDHRGRWKRNGLLHLRFG
ncbi:hypothetical protein LIER_02381 [Lithospermum erythrorhizon]|uniref:RNase H type-1 domain-containing protein n=1 Tax=Lithospermum erythrorhizon TaxID=34254 RepID=A0AAV3NTX4_LITER